MKNLLGIKITEKEFDRLMCEQSFGKEIKVVEGKLVAIEHVPTVTEAKEQRITELKQKLAETDYKAIKFAEGQLSTEDYAETKAQRQAWRDEINRLEVE